MWKIGLDTKEFQMIKISVEDLDKTSQWPCYDYCAKLLKEGTASNERLEVWNYSREVPEADYTIPNIGKYVKSIPKEKKRGIKHRELTIYMPL